MQQTTVQRTVGIGHWSVGSCQGQLSGAVVRGKCTVGSGQWTVGIGQWAVDSGLLSLVWHIYIRFHYKIFALFRFKYSLEVKIRPNKKFE
jgi:hypothetical protein